MAGSLGFFLRILIHLFLQLSHLSSEYQLDKHAESIKKQYGNE
jgi:hypothetical protein